MKREEELLYDESQEISVGEDTGWVAKITAAFPAFGSRNYRLYFAGQLVSLVGTWLQIVAEGWLVLQLTNSAFYIGLIAALATAPSLLFSLFGGVIVDSFSKRKILLFTQSMAMVLAILYGLLTVFHIITIWEIAVLAFLLGMVNALDIPARQSFVIELVGGEALPSAIALNSAVFNAARVVGPAVAGALIAVVGTGGAFLLNGVSYIASIAGLYYIVTSPVVRHGRIHPIKAIKEGISYSFSHPIIRILLIFTGVISVFGWSYSTIMPYIARNTFHIDASGLGYLYAASGLGALAGTFLLSAFSKKFTPAAFIIGGNTLFAVSLILFSFSRSTAMALPLLFLGGTGLITTFATMNTTLQQMVDNSMRGRVMSIYTLMFLGLSPLGNFQIGFVAEHFGPGTAIRIGAIIALLFGILVYLRRNKIREAHRQYKDAE